MAKYFALTTVVLGLTLVSSPVAAQTTQDLQWDSVAAASYLDERLAWWMSWEPAQREGETFCISCHTAVPYALSRPALRAVGGEPLPVPQEEALLDNVRRRVQLWAEVAPEELEARGSEAILNGLVLASHDARYSRLSDEARLALDHLWELQLDRGDESGSWPWLHADLEPWEEDGGSYYGAALAAVAVGSAPEGYAYEVANAERVARLSSYLTGNYGSQNLFNRLTVLWASTWLPGLLEPADQARVVEETLARQHGDGGWSLSSLGPYHLREGSPRVTESDGYATGMIAFVLLRTGAALENPGLKRALAWLSANQEAADGSWPAHSLNKHRDPSSDIGRFMRDAATAYAVLALTQTSLADPNPLLGTWTLNVEKSHIDYAPLPRNEKRTYRAAASNGMIFSVEGTDGAGVRYGYGSTAALDGREYSMAGTGTRNGGDAVSWRLVEPNTVSAVVTKLGDVVNRVRLSVSTDGRALTITEHGKNPNGMPTEGVRVYDRQ
jgi:squalene-hopene/tetraprenyl-beta-curcumene cyclase